MDKKCIDCGDTNTENFYTTVNNRCKTHHRAKVAAYRSENIEKVREKDRQRGLLPHRVKARKEYAETDQGREARNRARSAWIERNKRSAHIIVGIRAHYEKAFGALANLPIERQASAASFPLRHP